MTDRGGPPSTLQAPPSAADGGSDARFLSLWSSLRTSASALTNEGDNSSFLSDADRRRKIYSALEAVSRLVFGLDGPRKEVATDGGGLELAVSLGRASGAFDGGGARSSPGGGEEGGTGAPAAEGNGPTDAALALATLKAVKCLVVRNPAGRTRARSASAFEIVGDALDLCTSLSAAWEAAEGGDGKATAEKEKTPNRAVVGEEALTALAALCLGDDLNALRGALTLRNRVEATAERFPKGVYPSLHQKVAYLRALFDAVEGEQKALVEAIHSLDFEENQNAKGEEISCGGHAQSPEEHFFCTLSEAERALRVSDKKGYEKAVSMLPAGAAASSPLLGMVLAEGVP